MPLVAGIYHSTPKEGSKRFVVHGRNGSPKQLVGEPHEVSAFVAVPLAAKCEQIDRADEAVRKASRFFATRVLGSDGYFHARSSSDSLGLKAAKAAEYAPQGKALGAPKQDPVSVLVAALGGASVRTVRVSGQAAKRPVDMHCARCGHDGEREADSLCSAAGKVFCCEACCDAYLAEHKPRVAAKPLAAAVAPAMPEPRFFMWPSRVPVY